MILDNLRLIHPHRGSISQWVDMARAYLADRLHVIDLSADEDATKILIDYSCAELNDFYTRQEFGLQTSKLATGVPEEVAAMLTVVAAQPGWMDASTRLMTTDPSGWRK